MVHVVVFNDTDTSLMTALASRGRGYYDHRKVGQRSLSGSHRWCVEAAAITDLVGEDFVYSRESNLCFTNNDCHLTSNVHL